MKARLSALPLICLSNIEYLLIPACSGDEVFSNFRRSGYPPYPGADPAVHATSDGFIHRLTHPVEEYKNNTKNVEMADTSIGRYNLGNRIFWDVE